MNPDLASRMQVVAAAVGDVRSEQQTCRVVGKTANRGNGVLTCQSGPFSACPPQSWCDNLVSSTLDTILAKLRPQSIDVVKVDIEGSECPMLQGAATLFSTYRPKLLQFEMNADTVRKCVPPTLARHGYTRGTYAGHDFNTVWVPNEIAQQLPPTPQPAECRPWDCSCQMISNTYGTSHNRWGRIVNAPTELQASLRRFWVIRGCKTLPAV
jgi:FkbM family methyltransferase